MKTVRLTLFLFIVLLIFGYSEKEPLSIKKVIVAGKIINQEKYPDNYTIKVFENDLVNSLGTYHTSFIEDDGSFKIEFEKSFSSDVYLIFGNSGRLITLFLNPEDSVYVEMDANEVLNPNTENRYNFQSHRFSGNNEQLNTEIKLFLPLIDNTNITEAERTMLPEKYLNYLENIKAKQNQILDSLRGTSKISNEFIQWTQLNIDYNFAKRLFHYTWIYPFFNNIKENRFQAIDIPTSFYKAIENIPIDSEAALKNGIYPMFLHEYFNANTYKKSTFYKKDRDIGHEFRKSNLFQDEFEKFLKKIQEEYNGVASEILLSQQLVGLLDTYKRIDVFENLYPKYKKDIRSRFCAIIDAKYSEIKLQKKSPENNKSLVKQDNGIGIAADDLLKKIIDKNKGKVIYLDFWAIWCGPCVAEFAYSKKIAKTFENKNIEFVYLCVKSEKGKWEDKIRENNLPGEHYLLNNSEYDILSQKFQIIGIPHYVLIDKSGNVVDNNAPRPSSDTVLIHLIEKYLD